MKRWSLRRRLLIRLAIIIGGFWISASMVAAYIVFDEISEVLDSSLEETAHRIAPLAKSLNLLASENDDATAQDDTETYEHDEYVSYQIQDLKGRLVFRSHEAPKSAWTVNKSNGFSIDENWRIYTIHIQASGLVIQVGESLEHRFTAVSEATLVMIAPVIIVLPIMLFLFRHILNRSFLPVIAFGQEIETRGSNNLSDVGSTELPNEFDSIRNRLNELLARLRLALAAERTFSSNSAHQLRTPVAAALAQSEMLERELEQAPQKERAGKLSEALRRLSRIVEKLLQLARADANQPVQRERTNISEIITVLMSDQHRINPQRSFVLKGFDNPIYAMGDADSLAIIFQNLIENAATYATPKTPVEIEVTNDGRILVRNDCDAFTPDFLAQMGERFVRGAQDTRGSGLGLAIIRSLARHSGLEFSIASPIPGQTRGFEAQLKLERTA